MDALVNTIVIESHNGVLVDHISGWNIEDNPMIDDVQVVILSHVVTPYVINMDGYREKSRPRLMPI